MDKNKARKNFYTTEENFVNTASATESCGAIPTGSDLTEEEYNNYNNVAGFSAVEIKDKPPFKENCKNKA